MIKKWLCQMCKHNKYCNHNFDFECQEAYNHFSETIPLWAKAILIKEVGMNNGD